MIWNFTGFVSCTASATERQRTSSTTRTGKHLLINMGFTKLQVPRPRVKKGSRRVDASWSRSSLSMRTFVSKLSLSNLRSSLNRPVTSCPVPATIQCGFSDNVSRHVALAAGSYFDVEAALLKDFARTRRPGSIKSTQVGFMSPYYRIVDSEEHRRPTYEDVMTGASGYVLVVMVELSDPAADFEDLIRFFFQIHDPTTKYRQGNDRGFQFASWIFCGDQEQYAVAKRVRAEVQDLLDHGMFKHVYQSQSVTTNMCLMGDFTPGPESHQKHFLTHNGENNCNRIRYDSWPTLGSDDASSMGFVSISSDEDEKLEASAKSSLHFRPKESLVHSMIRISMCDRPEEDGSVE